MTYSFLQLKLQRVQPERTVQSRDRFIRASLPGPDRSPLAARVSVCTSACKSVRTPDRGPLLHRTRCDVTHKRRASPPPRPSGGTSPEGQHGQGAVGLVASVTAQPAAPEVMMPQVPQRRLRAEVLQATQQTAGSGLRPPPGQKPSLLHVSHWSWVQPPSPSHPAPSRASSGLHCTPLCTFSKWSLPPTVRAPAPSRTKPMSYGDTAVGVLRPLS